jgi:hypothetical protein
LLDVFFAGEHIGHQIRISLGIPPQERKPQRLKASTIRLPVGIDRDVKTYRSELTVRYPNNQEPRSMVPGAKATFC